MNEKIYKLLIKEAKEGYKEDEIPVGAVITKNGEIIASAHNQKEKYRDVTAHAEILAIKKASEIEKDYRLDEYTLYVTLEPCSMCKEVIRQSRIKRVEFLLKSNFDNEKNKNINYVENLSNSVENTEYKALLQEYFKEKR